MPEPPAFSEPAPDPPVPPDASLAPPELPEPEPDADPLPPEDVEADVEAEPEAVESPPAICWARANDESTEETAVAPVNDATPNAPEPEPRPKADAASGAAALTLEAPIVTGPTARVEPTGPAWTSRIWPSSHRADSNGMTTALGLSDTTAGIADT